MRLVYALVLILATSCTADYESILFWGGAWGGEFSC